MKGSIEYMRHYEHSAKPTKGIASVVHLGINQTFPITSALAYYTLKIGQMRRYWKW